MIDKACRPQERPVPSQGLLLLGLLGAVVLCSAPVLVAWVAGSRLRLVANGPMVGGDGSCEWRGGRARKDMEELSGDGSRSVALLERQLRAHHSTGAIHKNALTDPAAAIPSVVDGSKNLPHHHCRITLSGRRTSFDAKRKALLEHRRSAQRQVASFDVIPRPDVITPDCELKKCLFFHHQPPHSGTH